MESDYVSENSSLQGTWTRWLLWVPSNDSMILGHFSLCGFNTPKLMAFRITENKFGWLQPLFLAGQQCLETC